MTGFLLIIGAALSLGVSPQAGSNSDQDSGFRLKVAKVTNINLPQIRMSFQSASKIDSKPSKLTFAKGVNLSNCSYFMTMLGGEKTVMALDPNTRTLAIDMDCDNKITRKELFTGIPFVDANTGTSAVKDALLFGPIYLQLWELKRQSSEQKDENGKVTETITPQTYGVDDFNEIEGVWFYVKTHGNRFLGLYLARYWTGKMNCCAGMHTVALLDADFDGMFTPRKSVEEKRGDKLAIDLDENGIFTRAEIFTLRDKMGVQGRTYRVAVQWDGSMVRLDQYRERILIGPPPSFARLADWGSMTKCRAGG
jgi:hypothetical protein